MTRALLTGLLICSACSSDDVGNGDAVSVVVDGDDAEFAESRAAICAEGLPAALSFSLTTVGDSCPNGVCQQLGVQLGQVAVGEPIYAVGTTAAVLFYNDYRPPATSVTTGDSGPNATIGAFGEVTIHAFEDLADGNYHVDFSLGIEAGAQVEATGDFVASVEPCRSS